VRGAQEKDCIVGAVLPGDGKVYPSLGVGAGDRLTQMPLTFIRAGLNIRATSLRQTRVDVGVPPRRARRPI